MSCHCHEVDLKVLNSMTKYPSIPTLHEMGERGRLGDLAVRFPEDQGVFATEKIDGANARLVLLPWGCWLVGSREEWLAHRGDLLVATAERIVEAIGPRVGMLEAALGVPRFAGGGLIWYGEAYGSKIGQGAKNYASNPGSLGFRVFDIQEFSPAEFDHRLSQLAADAAAWRESGGPRFFDLDCLVEAAGRAGVPTVPYLARVAPGSWLRLDHEGTLELLRKTVSETAAALDEGAKKRPEGIVFRTADRSVIAKARFEDYERAVGAKR